MSEQSSILVLGLGPIASATARLLFLAGFSVAIDQAQDPKILRRKMSFADCWGGANACLDGVDALTARRENEFLAGLRQKEFVPVLTRPIAGAVERWPWDFVIDASRESGAAAPPLLDAPFRIGLSDGGPGGPVAGEDCDLVIATEGPDPGALLRAGPAPKTVSRAEIGFVSGGLVASPTTGRFRAESVIGAAVEKGQALGHVGAAPILAPRAGRLVGLRRPGAGVAAGEWVAEVAHDPQTPFAGVGKREQQIARAALFAVQMEVNGWEPVAFSGFA